MKTLPEFMLMEHPTELKGQVFILQTSHPHLIGQVWRFQTDAEMDDFLKRYGGTAIAKLSDYRVVVAYYNNMLQVPFHYSEARPVMAEMIQFFYTVRMIPNAAKFERYRNGEADPE